MPLGAAIGAVSAIGGGLLQSGAASAAAKKVEAANQQNQAFLGGVYNTAGQNLAPELQNNVGASSELAGLLGIGGNPQASNTAFNNYLNSTNYNFLKSQGENALEYANAPAFNSGATGKALINYGQNMAGNALQGYEQMLYGQQGLGTQAALGLGQIGSSVGSTMANSNLQAAGAAGSAGMAGATAWGNAFNNLSGIANQALTQSSFGGLGGSSGSSATGGNYSQFADLLG